MAYGMGFLKKPKSRGGGFSPNAAAARTLASSKGEASDSRPATLRRRQTDEEIIQIRRKLAEFARKQNREDLRAIGKKSTSQFTAAASTWDDSRPQSGSGVEGSGRGLAPSNSGLRHHGYSSDDEEWESASDGEGSDDSDEYSALAYGHAELHTPRPAESSVGRMNTTSAKSPAMSRKSTLVDPELFGPSNSLRAFVDTPCGFNNGSSAYTIPVPTEMRHAGSVESASVEARPMQRVFPLQTSDSSRMEAARGSGSIVSQQPTRSSSRPEPLPIQAPKPITPVSSRIFEEDRIGDPDLSEHREHRRKSTKDNSIFAETALVGAGVAALGAAMLASRDKGKGKEPELERRDKYGHDDHREDDIKVREARKAEELALMREIGRLERALGRTNKAREERRRDSKRDGETSEARASEANADQGRHYERERERRRRERQTRRSEPSTSERGSRVSEPGERPAVDGDGGAKDHQVEDPSKPGSSDDINVFNYQVSDDSFRARDEPSIRAASPLIIDVTPSPSPAPEQSPRSRRESVQEEQRETRHIYDEATQSTAPITDVAMAAATAATDHSRRYDEEDERGRTSSRTADQIQEDANRYYHARRVAEREQRSRSRSESVQAERSVVDNYEDDEETRKPPRIVTPPEMASKTRKDRYSEPDADFSFDDMMSPTELLMYKPREAPVLDPSAREPRPVLNLVMPTPVPTPSSEKQNFREKGRVSKDLENEAPAVVLGPRGEVVNVTEATEEPPVTPKTVSWGPSETKQYEVESFDESSHEHAPEKPKGSGKKTSGGWGVIAAAVAGASAGAAMASDNRTESPRREERDRAEDGRSEGSRSPPKERPVLPTAVSSRVLVDEPEELPPVPGPKPASQRSSHIPGAFEEDIDFAATLAAGLEHSGFDPEIVIEDPEYRRRESPPGSNEALGWGYTPPFAETADDLGMFGDDDGSRTVREPGYVIGEVAETPAIEKAASFEDPVVEDTGSTGNKSPKLSKKEQRKLEKAAKAAKRAEEEQQATGPVEAGGDEWADAPTSKKSKKSNKAKRASVTWDDADTPINDSHFSVPVAAFDVEGADDWDTPKKSKKSKRGSKSYDLPDDDPPDLRDPLRDRYEPLDREIASIVSDTPYDDRSNDHSHDDGRSVASAPTGSERKSEKRSSGLWSRLMGSSNGEDKESSKKGSAGTLGAGAGIAGAAVALTALARSDAADAPRKQEEPHVERDVNRRWDSLSREVDILEDPEIAPRAFKPAIDPQFGDLLPLPPSPGAEGYVDFVEDEAPPPLPDSRSATPPEQARPRLREREVDFLEDPEIAPRVIKPAIDPQFGDLLPLPPSPVEKYLDFVEDEALPALPNSRPGTPPSLARPFLRERESSQKRPGHHSRRTSIYEMPPRSPSHTAIPINFRMSMSQRPSPVAVSQTPPIVQSPPTPGQEFSPTFKRPSARPTSWDSSREFKPLYLLEQAGRTPKIGAEEFDNAAETTSLPPSRDSPAPKPKSGNAGAVSPVVKTAPLVVETDVARSATLGSQESTPRGPRDAEHDLPSSAKEVTALPTEHLGTSSTSLPESSYATPLESPKQAFENSSPIEISCVDAQLESIPRPEAEPAESHVEETAGDPGKNSFSSALSMLPATALAGAGILLGHERSEKSTSPLSDDAQEPLARDPSPDSSDRVRTQSTGVVEPTQLNESGDHSPLEPHALDFEITETTEAPAPLLFSDAVDIDHQTRSQVEELEVTVPVSDSAAETTDWAVETGSKRKKGKKNKKMQSISASPHNSGTDGSSSSRTSDAPQTSPTQDGTTSKTEEESLSTADTDLVRSAAQQVELPSQGAVGSEAAHAEVQSSIHPAVIPEAMGDEPSSVDDLAQATRDTLDKKILSQGEAVGEPVLGQAEAVDEPVPSQQDAVDDPANLEPEAHVHNDPIPTNVAEELVASLPEADQGFGKDQSGVFNEAGGASVYPVDDSWTNTFSKEGKKDEKQSVSQPWDLSESSVLDSSGDADTFNVQVPNVPQDLTPEDVVAEFPGQLDSEKFVESQELREPSGTVQPLDSDNTQEETQEQGHLGPVSLTEEDPIVPDPETVTNEAIKGITARDSPYPAEEQAAAPEDLTSERQAEESPTKTTEQRALPRQEEATPREEEFSWVSKKSKKNKKKRKGSAVIDASTSSSGMATPPEPGEEAKEPFWDSSSPAHEDPQPKELQLGSTDTVISPQFVPPTETNEVQRSPSSPVEVSKPVDPSAELASSLLEETRPNPLPLQNSETSEAGEVVISSPADEVVKSVDPADEPGSSLQEEAPPNLLPLQNVEGSEASEMDRNNSSPAEEVGKSDNPSDERALSLQDETRSDQLLLQNLEMSGATGRSVDASELEGNSEELANLEPGAGQVDVMDSNQSTEPEVASDEAEQHLEASKEPGIQLAQDTLSTEVSATDPVISSVEPQENLTKTWDEEEIARQEAEASEVHKEEAELARLQLKRKPSKKDKQRLRDLRARAHQRAEEAKSAAAEPAAEPSTEPFGQGQDEQPIPTKVVEADGEASVVAEGEVLKLQVAEESMMAEQSSPITATKEHQQPNSAEREDSQDVRRDAETELIQKEEAELARLTIKRKPSKKDKARIKALKANAEGRERVAEAAPRQIENRSPASDVSQASFGGVEPQPGNFQGPAFVGNPLGDLEGSKQPELHASPQLQSGDDGRIDSIVQLAPEEPAMDLPESQNTQNEALSPNSTADVMRQLLEDRMGENPEINVEDETDRLIQEGDSLPLSTLESQIIPENQIGTLQESLTKQPDEAVLADAAKPRVDLDHSDNGNQSEKVEAELDQVQTSNPPWDGETDVATKLAPIEPEQNDEPDVQSYPDWFVPAKEFEESKMKRKDTISDDSAQPSGVSTALEAGNDVFAGDPAEAPAAASASSHPEIERTMEHMNEQVDPQDTTLLDEDRPTVAPSQNIMDAEEGAASLLDESPGRTQADATHHRVVVLNQLPASEVAEDNIADAPLLLDAERPAVPSTQVEQSDKVTPSLAGRDQAVLDPEQQTGEHDPHGAVEPSERVASPARSYKVGSDSVAKYTVDAGHSGQGSVEVTAATRGVPMQEHSGTSIMAEQLPVWHDEILSTTSEESEEDKKERASASWEEPESGTHTPIREQPALSSWDTSREIILTEDLQTSPRALSPDQVLPQPSETLQMDDWSVTPSKNNKEEKNEKQWASMSSWEPDSSTQALLDDKPRESSGVVQETARRSEVGDTGLGLRTTETIQQSSVLPEPKLEARHQGDDDLPQVSERVSDDPSPATPTLSMAFEHAPPNEIATAVDLESKAGDGEALPVVTGEQGPEDGVSSVHRETTDERQSPASPQTPEFAPLNEPVMKSDLRNQVQEGDDTLIVAGGQIADEVFEPLLSEALRGNETVAKSDMEAEVRDGEETLIVAGGKVSDEAPSQLEVNRDGVDQPDFLSVEQNSMRPRSPVPWETEDDPVRPASPERDSDLDVQQTTTTRESPVPWEDSKSASDTLLEDPPVLGEDPQPTMTSSSFQVEEEPFEVVPGKKSKKDKKKKKRGSSSQSLDLGSQPSGPAPEILQFEEEPELAYGEPLETPKISGTVEEKASEPAAEETDDWAPKKLSKKEQRKAKKSSTSTGEPESAASTTEDVSKFSIGHADQLGFVPQVQEPLPDFPSHVGIEQADHSHPESVPLGEPIGAFQQIVVPETDRPLDTHEPPSSSLESPPEEKAFDGSRTGDVDSPNEPGRRGSITAEQSVVQDTPVFTRKLSKKERRQAKKNAATPWEDDVFDVGSPQIPSVDSITTQSIPDLPSPTAEEEQTQEDGGISSPKPLQPDQDDASFETPVGTEPVAEDEWAVPLSRKDSKKDQTKGKQLPSESVSGAEIPNTEEVPLSTSADWEDLSSAKLAIEDNPKQSTVDPSIPAKPEVGQTSHVIQGTELQKMQAQTPSPDIWDNEDYFKPKTLDNFGNAPLEEPVEKFEIHPAFARGLDNSADNQSKDERPLVGLGLIHRHSSIFQEDDRHTPKLLTMESYNMSVESMALEEAGPLEESSHLGASSGADLASRPGDSDKLRERSSEAILHKHQEDLLTSGKGAAQKVDAPPASDALSSNSHKQRSFPLSPRHSPRLSPKPILDEAHDASPSDDGQELAKRGSVALLAEKFGGSKKGKGKSQKVPKYVDKRRPQEDDIFDEPAMWEGAEPKAVEVSSIDGVAGDFWTVPETKLEEETPKSDLHTVQGSSPVAHIRETKFDDDNVSATNSLSGQGAGRFTPQIPEHAAREEEEPLEPMVLESPVLGSQASFERPSTESHSPGRFRGTDKRDPAEVAALTTTNDEHRHEEHGVPSRSESPASDRGAGLGGSTFWAISTGGEIAQTNIAPIADFRRPVSGGLPPVREEPQEEEAGFGKRAPALSTGLGTADVNRDSGFMTDSPVPPWAHRFDDTQQRDSGLHLRDYPDTSSRLQKSGSVSPDANRLSRSSVEDDGARLDDKFDRSPMADSESRRRFRGSTPTFEAQEPPVTPEPQKNRSGKPREHKYGDLGLGIPPAATRGAGAGLLAAARSESPSPSSPAEGHRSLSDNTDKRRVSPSPQDTLSSQRRAVSNTRISRSRTPEPLSLRPNSPSLLRHSGTPPLRSRRTRSGDLWSLGQSSQQSRSDLGARISPSPGPSTVPVTAPSPTPDAAKTPVPASSSSSDLRRETTPAATAATQISNSNPVANEGRVRAKDMADVYVSRLYSTALSISKIDKYPGLQDGFGEGRLGSPRSPTRPHSMRRRQSMQVLELESRVEQLIDENRALNTAKLQAELHSTNRATSVIAERDNEIETLKQSLEFMRKEIQRLTEVNEGLNSAIAQSAVQHEDRYRLLESQYAADTRELEGFRVRHGSHTRTLEEKNTEIRSLREQLEATKEQIREMQKQILATSDFLQIKDVDYFDHRCQQLCSHVQQWVLRFSKFSDMRACRLTSELNDEKIIDRLDNAVLDGSNVDNYLNDRVRRRDIFMSVTMTMIWEFIFTRYLFGMDREQRQKLKALEKLLLEVGPPKAVRQWRAVTLTLLAKREVFEDQREQDTEAVVQAVFQTLSVILPPPSNLEDQIQGQLRKVVREAVDLSIQMRTQRAEYMMLPPLQPEYDANGDLAEPHPFNATLMSERSGKNHVDGDELQAEGAIVRAVLFPLVVKKGDDDGVGDDEVVVCPAQVIVSKPRSTSRRSTRAPSSDAGGVSLLRGGSPSTAPNRSNVSMHEAEYIEGGI